MIKEEILELLDKRITFKKSVIEAGDANQFIMGRLDAYEEIRDLLKENEND